jgi:hypothetical protein
MHCCGAVTANVKRYTSPGIDEFVAELIHELSEALCYEIYILFTSILNKE